MMFELEGLTPQNGGCWDRGAKLPRTRHCLLFSIYPTGEAVGVLSLNSYRDLLQKCETELQLLVSCDKHPEYDFILFNLVLGLNHLFEWYLLDEDTPETAKHICIQRLNPFEPGDRIPRDFNQLYDGIQSFPEMNHHQQAIRQLSNKAKHFKKTEVEHSSKNYTCGCGEPGMECGEPGALAGAFNHYVYSVNIQGSDVGLLAVATALIDEWHEIAGKTE
jgi:hypothetical protein